MALAPFEIQGARPAGTKGKEAWRGLFWGSIFLGARSAFQLYPADFAGDGFGQVVPELYDTGYL